MFLLKKSFFVYIWWITHCYSIYN